MLIAAVILGQIVFLSVCDGASTDALIGKAAKVTTSLARGDVNGAAGQAIGGYKIPVAPGSNLYTSPSRVGFQQAVKPLGANQRYLNVGTAYNVSVNPVHPTKIAQNVQVNSGNPYFSNRTTIPIPMPRKI